MDFGISTREGEQPLGILGTPESTPPEVLSQSSSDLRVDVFQLGVLAYRLFAMCPPWAHSGCSNPLEVATSMSTELRAPFLENLIEAAAVHRPDFERLEPLISKSLQSEPDRRPMSVRPWVVVLDRIIADGVIPVAPPVWIHPMALDAALSSRRQFSPA